MKILLKIVNGNRYLIDLKVHTKAEVKKVFWTVPISTYVDCIHTYYQ